MPTPLVGQYALLSLKNKYGKVLNEMWVIGASTGWGKGLAMESIVEELHKEGYLVLVIADPKKENEFGFQMFKPREKYHLDNLRAVGKVPEGKKVKLYHPFCFTLPKGSMPDYNIFTIPLKDLGEHEWGLIVETGWESESVSLLMKTSNEIKNEDGLYAFMHTAQEMISTKHEGKKRKANKKNFGLKVGSGSFKSITEISRLLYPFIQNYFLSSKNSKYNLDWEKILTDQEHYHVFTTEYLNSEKLSQFVVLYLMEAVFKNRKFLKRPVVFVIPELRNLCPYYPEGYKKFLSDAVKNCMSMARSSGRGMSFLTDTQVWGGLDKQVKGSASAVLFGKLTADDIHEISQKWTLNRDTKEFLKAPRKPNSFLWIQDEDQDVKWTIWFPSGMHKEPEYNFREMYLQHYREDPEKYPLVNFNEIIKEMAKEYSAEEKKFLDIEKKKEEKERELEEKKKAEKEAKSSKTEEVKIIKEKAKQSIDKSREVMMKLCYQEKHDNPKMSNHDIAKKLGITHSTVGKYLKIYKEKIDNQDFSEKVIEELKEAENEEEARKED